MSQINSREVVLLNAASVTTNASGPDIVLPAGIWHAATISLVATTSTGTTETLDVKLQRKLGEAAATDAAGGFPTGTAIYDDLLGFSQVTTSAATQLANLISLPMAPTANANTITTVPYTPLDGTMTAGTARVAPLGTIWRIKYVITGTTPVYTFSVVAQLTPYGS